ncbi:hypothetical protein MKZ38_004652 [Zalerion maritima]|uniref:Epoxide hydrolase N-terminal domain-containing protein n=1 Tax=Zalerion maritima TaxID=339359 RepID=A0AAD5WPF7_9PEZI|nr:hypothetical protein MKZ38_004652 [Zalerion maritima]
MGDQPIASPGEGVTSPPVDDAVKPYQIHVPTKHLDRTREKLELTRLPHEGKAADSAKFWDPRATVERLVDSWLDQYSWRDYESEMNATLPQFRTTVKVPGSEALVRLHCIHARSQKTGSIPLLLIPPFPFANVSLMGLVKLFTAPEDQDAQAFHLVIPSFPGIGFSDPIPDDAPPIATTAHMFDTLMSRLSYPHYLVTNSSPSFMSPAQIDWKLAHHLATHYPNSCAGVHLISPPMNPPRPQDGMAEWGKWKLAKFFHAPLWGYRSEDFEALGQVSAASAMALAGSRTVAKKKTRGLRAVAAAAQLGLGRIVFHDPNFLAYALCDSPTGLIVFVLRALRAWSGSGDVPFGDKELINLVLLAWIPGPEYGLRYWARCAGGEDVKAEKKGLKPRVAVTVFMGDEKPDEKDGTEEYACPAWANTKYSLVSTRRVRGKPGLLAWTRPEEIALGVRGLAKEALKAYSKLKAIVTAPLEGVVVADEGGTDPASVQENPGAVVAAQAP